MLAAPIQTTLDLGIPLHQVTFCVVDLETTGGSPADCTDHRGRGGQVPRRRAHRVVPGTGQPRDPDPAVHHPSHRDRRPLGGRRAADRGDPARVPRVLPGRRVRRPQRRFDFSFLNANLTRLDYDPLPAPAVCTARLARRVVWPDVPNVRLQTLARYFRTRVQPNHRAFADAEACAEVLPRAARPGRAARHPHAGRPARGRARHGARLHFGKIGLADHLPHAPGVYLFRGRDGRVLYVGKSKDLRARVKSYFYGDERKKIDDLLSETTVDRGRRVRLRDRGARRRGAADPPSRAEVQPAREDVAPLRVPQDRSRRGVPPAEGRARGRPGRRLHAISGRSGRPPRPSSPRKPSRRSCRSAGAPRRWARGRGSHRAPWPTWVGASRRATAASIPSATESSSGGSSPP